MHLLWMSGSTLKSFGVIIAFLLPGFIATWGLSYHSGLVSTWLAGCEASSTSVGGVALAMLLALGCGLIASTVRWMAIDTLHHRTGIQKRDWDFRQLQPSIGAYQILEENHYRFYQFYGNSLCALVFTILCGKLDAPMNWGQQDIVMFLVAVVLFLGSRDCLGKYYKRVDDLMDRSET